MKLALTTILIAMATLFIYSCGDDAKKTTGEKDTRTGITKCGEDINQKECKAGQYCASEIFGTCEAGCSSDDNCLANQVCKISAEEKVGVCENKEVTGTTN